MRVIIILFLMSISLCLSAQIKAKAISYKVVIDLSAFAPNYIEDAAADTVKCIFEVDAYYTAEKMRTRVRTVRRPKDYELGIRQRYYLIDSKDEYNIDPNNNYILLKKNQEVKLKGTGKQKNILGYNCKEYTFTDHRNIQFSVWVTDKLQKNICPTGNYSLKGTALQIDTSNGLHYIATDLAEGELNADFFDIPQNFQKEELDLAAADKKPNK
jgi:hypothetical protein